MARARALTRVVMCALLVCGWAAFADAQQFTGGIRGAVRDANGVIPGVTVTVTNEVGQYNFPALPPGTYTVKSQITGYKTFESKGFTVGTQQFLTLDIVLEVGAISENITVTGQSPLIDTSTASAGAVLNRETL